MATIVHTFSAAGAWSDTAPVGTVSVVATLNGGGGNGTGTPGGKGPPNGAGGGGGAYCALASSLSGGTPLSGNVGDGSGTAGGSGDTTCTQLGMTAGSGGNALTSGSYFGVGGTASGGSTNTSGQQGGAVSLTDGGSSPNGGASQTTQGASGNPPGGGGAGNTTSGGSPGAGATGQVVLTYTVNTPTVTLNPSDDTVVIGAVASFTAAASNSVSVQWFVSTNNGSSYSAVGGATSTTYTFTPTLGQSGNLYYAAFTNPAGTTNTMAARLTVVRLPFTLADQPNPVRPRPAARQEPGPPSLALLLTPPPPPPPAQSSILLGQAIF